MTDLDETCKCLSAIVRTLRAGIGLADKIVARTLLLEVGAEHVYTVYVWFVPNTSQDNIWACTTHKAHRASSKLQSICMLILLVARSRRMPGVFDDLGYQLKALDISFARGTSSETKTFPLIVSVQM